MSHAHIYTRLRLCIYFHALTVTRIVSCIFVYLPLVYLIVEKLFGHFMDQCGICNTLSVLGRLWVPVDILHVRILHYGLLECMFG